MKWNVLICCSKSNPNFRNITWRVAENMILHEIFRVVSRFPRYISCYIAENQLPLGQCCPGHLIAEHSLRNRFNTKNIFYLYFLIWILKLLRSLTPWWEAHCEVWLRGGMHTAEFCWEIWWPWLCGVMHTAELDFAVGCPPWSQIDSKLSVFRVFVLALLTSFYRKTFEEKKISWTICDFCDNFILISVGITEK